MAARSKELGGKLFLAGRDGVRAEPYSEYSFVDEMGKACNRHTMKISLPLKEMTLSEKIGVMEEVWSDLSAADSGYSPPEWHEDILAERLRLAEAGEVGFTDWEVAKKQISDRVFT